jgi:cytochrome c biogenesis protein CcmG/thiol:disulfide interchange protein DsbE
VSSRWARRARPRFVLPALVGVVALLALLSYGVGAGGRSQSLDRAIADGRRPPAPPLSLPALDAPGRRSLASYRGRVVVLNFWASWCPPCRAETPLLQRWHRRMAARGTVIGVDVLDVTDDALAFARARGLDYPLVRDRDGGTARDFGVAGYPETVVVDRRGRVAAIQRGPVDDSFYASQVLPLLRERS